MIILDKKKSKFKGVFYRLNTKNNKKSWVMQIHHEGFRAFKEFEFSPDGEKKAARAYDLKRIEFGKEPVNLLKKK